MRSRLAAAAAVAAALAFPSVGHAAPAKPQITDATGDQLPVGDAGYDIVSALFKTEGTTTKVGRKKVYTPTKLVVVVTYAGTAAPDDNASQAVEFDLPTCANVYLQSYSGGTWAFADCWGPDPFPISAKVSGKTVTFTVPFSAIGKQHLKPGVTLTGLRTFTSYADPLAGYDSGQFSGDLMGAGALDEATSTATYKVA